MLAQADIVRTLLAARMRISASAWVIVRDAQAAEDIFQNVTVKALALVPPALAAEASSAPSAAATSASASFAAAEHPFILWTKGEAAAIRRRIETEPWAKAQYEAMLKEKGNSQTFRKLFRYQVMGDESVVDAEKKYLVSLIGNDPRRFTGDTGGGRHYDQYLSVLRYDALYDRLSASERQGLEDTFRDFIRHHCEEEKLRFTRTSWLPNMQWPRPVTAHLMAVALRDEKLIRQCFNSRGGWKYYFDDYLGDGRFYFEEFGKQYSMIGELFLWCRGVERLGLDELGYGYTGNRQISNGYGGGCPWTDSARGHCGVMVDGLQYLANDADPAKDHPHWPNPIGEVPTRSGFDPLVKFVAARARPAGGSVSLDNRQPLGTSTLSLDLRREEPEI